MEFLVEILFGIYVGSFAAKPAKSRFWALALGVLGSLASSSLAVSFGFYQISVFQAYSFIIAIIGSVAAIYIGRSLMNFKY